MAAGIGKYPQGAFLRHFNVAVEKERAQPVEDRPAFVDLDAAERMGAAAHDDIGAGVDGIVEKANEKIAMTLPNVCAAMKANRDAVMKQHPFVDADALNSVIK